MFIAALAFSSPAICGAQNEKRSVDPEVFPRNEQNVKIKQCADLFRACSKENPLQDLYYDFLTEQYCKIREEQLQCTHLYHKLIDDISTKLGDSK